MNKPSPTDARWRAITMRATCALQRAWGWIDPYLGLSVIGLTGLIVLALVTRHDAGVTLDEVAQMRYGRRIAAWYVSGFSDRRAVFADEVIARYGGLFDAVAQFFVHFTPEDPVGTRHAASALCAIAGIVATWLIAARLGGRLAGLVAATLLAATPVWLGHGLFNPKDTPFAAAAAWSVYGMLSFALAPRLPSWRASIGCGVAIGAALGVRPGGMFLLTYPVLALLGGLPMLLTEPTSARRLRTLTGAATRVAVCWATAWLCMLSAWPWAQEAPFRHPFEAAWTASHSSWQGTMLFRGALVQSAQLPRSYLPVWFAVSLPETYLLALLCAAPLLWLWLRRRPHFDRHVLGLGCVAFAAVGPVLGCMLTRPTIYDAQRHFLFVLPPLAALAGLAFARFLQEPSYALELRSVVLGTLLALWALAAVDSVRLHPYEYVYFNHLAGGLRGAQARFETEYWGASQQEALTWLAGQLRADDDSPVRVASCNHDDGVREFLREHPQAAHRIKFERRGENADIYLATTRNNCHKTAGQVLHVVERMGVPFLYVIQRRAIASNGTGPHHASHPGG